MPCDAMKILIDFIIYLLINEYNEKTLNGITLPQLKRNTRQGGKFQCITKFYFDLNELNDHIAQLTK